jgi:hypothetical protein
MPSLVRLNSLGPVHIYFHKDASDDYVIRCDEDDFSAFPNTLEEAAAIATEHFKQNHKNKKKEEEPVVSSMGDTSAAEGLDTDVNYGFTPTPGSTSSSMIQEPEPEPKEKVPTNKIEPSKKPSKKGGKYGEYVKKATRKVLTETGRGDYIKQAEEYGYAELPEFKGKEDWNGHFNCASCEYFLHKDDSPTGYWCRAINIPDMPDGCCNIYDLRPDLRDEQKETNDAPAQPSEMSTEPEERQLTAPEPNVPLDPNKISNFAPKFKPKTQ